MAEETNHKWEEIFRKFAIDQEIGFLFPEPATKLPPPYDVWQQIADNLPASMESGELWPNVANLEELSVEDSLNEKELRLAHMTLASITSAYVWGKGEAGAPAVLPRQLSRPFMTVSKKLNNLPPNLCYPSFCLANYTKKDQSLPLTAENMSIIGCKFIEDYGNDWFYLDMCQIELDFVPVLKPLVCACLLMADAAQSDEAKLSSVREALSEATKCLKVMRKSLANMSKHLTPNVFFNDVRPYLQGYMAGIYKEQGGLIFEGCDNPGPFKFTGASAAQSCTLQAMDAFLQIEHPEANSDFLNKQRAFMLSEHRAFIEWIGAHSSLRSLIQAYDGAYPSLHEAYNDCVKEVTGFRTDHVGTATKYILTPKAKQAKKFETLSSVGTGGTDFVVFLKGCRDDTKNMTMENGV